MSADGVESEDKGSFASEMSEEDDFGAFPDLSRADELALFLVSDLPLIHAEYFTYRL